jgi:hypothetical protein
MSVKAMDVRMFFLKHLTSLVDPILRQRMAGLSRGVQSHAFGGRLIGIRTPPKKVPLLIYGCGKLQNRTLIIGKF